MSIGAPLLQHADSCIVYHEVARAQMEDRAACVPDLLQPCGVPLGYYAVFDGHEGAAAAENASAQLHSLLARGLRSCPRQDP